MLTYIFYKYGRRHFFFTNYTNYANYTNITGRSVLDKLVLPDTKFGNAFPFIAIIFICLVSVIAFKYESRKAKKFLVKLLEAQETAE
jgi:hypothetical protein